MFNKKMVCLFLLIFSNTLSSTENKANIGLLIVATGKYICFVPNLIASAKRHFMPDQNVKIFLFTDTNYKDNNVTVLEHKRIGWPMDSMNRYELYYKHKDKFADLDYLFTCDADLQFIGNIDSTILGDRVALKHPHFDNRRGVYESRNIFSKAYVAPHEGQHYFYGAFLGGTKNEFLKMSKTLSENIEADNKLGITAEIIDESHVNRYFIDNKPTIILNSKFGNPQEWGYDEYTKILYLMKNHDEMRK